MKAEIFNNLLNNQGVVSSDDMNADEKKNLFAYMVSNGSTEAFAYDRFFREGFAIWELCGIDKVKKDFLRDYQIELTRGEPVATSENGKEDPCDGGDRGYGAVLLYAKEGPGQFYRAVSQVRGLIGKLKTRMSELGMCETTTWKRFQADNWKEFERIGIRKIVEDYLKSQKNK